MTTTPAFTRDPDVHSGAAVFPGTRVPISTLFDYLIGDQEDGLNHFLEDYDHISREAVNAVLDRAKHVLIDPDNQRTTPSSGNVFRDLGRPDPDLLLFKAHLAAHVSQAIARRGLTQAQAAELLYIDQPRVSHLIVGHLSGGSIDALLGYLKRLDVKMNISIEDPVADPAERVLITV